ncbi:MAG: helix-turn-helix transcriptional regulator [Proteobacteria bacterium]|nr:helix-turn-helix transcriptional regulator [Pseudomonadota bacterium]
MIRFLRTEAGLTTRSLDEKCKISQSALSELEAGRAQPTISQLFKVDRALLQYASCRHHHYRRGEIFDLVQRLERELVASGVAVTFDRMPRAEIGDHLDGWRELLEAHLHLWAADRELGLTEAQLEVVSAAVPRLIRRLRKGAGVSLSAFGAELPGGLHHTTLSQVENGVRGLSARRLLEIDRALNQLGITRSPGDLLGMIISAQRLAPDLPDGSQQQQIEALLDALVGPAEEA